MSIHGPVGHCAQEGAKEETVPGLNWTGPETGTERTLMACAGKGKEHGKMTMVKRGVSQEQACVHGRGTQHSNYSK